MNTVLYTHSDQCYKSINFVSFVIDRLFGFIAYKYRRTNHILTHRIREHYCIFIVWCPKYKLRFRP